MVALLLAIGALSVAMVVATFWARDPHHEFMFDLVQLLDYEHRIGRDDKQSGIVSHAA